MNRDVINAVVQDFLESAKAEYMPHRQVSDLLRRLQSEGWTQADLREVQTGIFNGIDQRRELLAE